MPKRVRSGQKQVNWWLPEDLLAELKEYQHEHRLDSLTEAAKQALESALKFWRSRQGKDGGARPREEAP